MTRLPTVGGDTAAWGTVLNDFLDTDYGFYGLNGGVSAGATSVVVDRLPGIIQSGAGQQVIIDPFTIEAEIRTITIVSGNTLTLSSALTYSHASGDVVYLIGLAAQGNVIPWSWFGGLPGINTDGAATQNVTAFNRLSDEIWNHSPGGIGIDGGYYVNNEIKPYESQALIGTHVFASKITARAGFPFDSTGSVAIIHPRRHDVGPVLFEELGPSGRWWFRNIYVDGNNLTDSNGIISSPQQPDSTENIRVDHCTGRYGLGLMDVQYHDLRNLHFDANAVSLYMWSCSFVRIYNMNFTSPASTTGISLVGVTDSSFYGGLFETVPTPGPIIDVTGGSSRLGFYDIYTSGFSGAAVGDVFYIDSEDNPTGKCTYVITNARCNQNSSTVNFLTDVQRSITLDSLTDTDRAIPFATAHANAAVFLLPTGMRHYGTAGYNGVEYGDGGVRDISGSGSPEGAIAAPVGSTYRRTNGGAATSFYVKESGTGNTGWVGK